MLYRHGLGTLFAVPFGLLSNNAARADEIFVTNFINNTGTVGEVGEYTTSGDPVNPSLITGLSNLLGIAVLARTFLSRTSSNNEFGNTSSEYTTARDPVNPALILGLNEPLARVAK